MIITNVCGPPMTCPIAGGKESISLQCLVPGFIAGGFTIVSHVDTVKIGFLCDQASCSDPREIMNCLESNIDEFL